MSCPGLQRGLNKTYQVINAPEIGVENDTTRISRYYSKKLEHDILLAQKDY
jgi:hypothetical protein